MAKTAIEEKLLGPQPDGIGQALLASSVEDEVFIEDNKLRRNRPKTTVLKDKEAMRFLGLPENRPFFQLRRGDASKIYERFKSYIVPKVQEGESADEVFWKKIRIRVWKVDNIGKFTATGEEYGGLIFYGNALEGFVPKERKSDAHTNYKVQLVDVEVTEEMENAIR